MIARIAAAVDADYPRRRDHIELVALVALRAKIRPMNVYAKATL